MAQNIYLSCGNGVVYDAASNTMICDSVGVNDFIMDSGYPRLEAADVTALLVAAIPVLALAWGFNVLGHFLFPRR